MPIFASREKPRAAAPPLPPEAGVRSEFLSDSGGAASIASSRSGVATVVTAAIRHNAGWRTFRITSTDGAFTVEADGVQDWRRIR